MKNLLITLILLLVGTPVLGCDNPTVIFGGAKFFHTGTTVGGISAISISCTPPPVKSSGMYPVGGTLPKIDPPHHLGPAPFLLWTVQHHNIVIIPELHGLPVHCCISTGGTGIPPSLPPQLPYVTYNGQNLEIAMLPVHLDPRYFLQTPSGTIVLKHIPIAEKIVVPAEDEVVVDTAEDAE